MKLQTLCESAALAGRSIILTGCDYGPHKRSGQFLGVQPYYHFLAGFVRALNLRKVLEIGTSYGGSMMAMHRGIQAGERGMEMVTVDKVDIAGEGLTRLLSIKRVHGNSLAPESLSAIKAHLRGPIDLLYIDSKHSYDHTDGNITQYGAVFRPRFVILDDIHLNAEMESLWNDLRDEYQDLAFDASDLAERPSGFGVLAYAEANAAIHGGAARPVGRKIRRRVAGLASRA